MEEQERGRHFGVGWGLARGTWGPRHSHGEVAGMRLGRGKNGEQLLPRACLGRPAVRERGSFPAPRSAVGGVPVGREGAGQEGRGGSPGPCLGEAEGGLWGPWGGWGWAPVQGNGEVQEGGHQLRRVAPG